MKPRNFREAAAACIAPGGRWYRMRKVRTNRGVRRIFKTTKCDLCELQKRRQRGRGRIFMYCKKCPLNDGANNALYCCGEFQNVCGGGSELKLAISVIYTMLERISKGEPPRLKKIAGIGQ